MTFLVLFSIFIASMLVWVACEFRATEQYETRFQYRLDIISLSTMLISFVGSLLASALTSVHGIG